MALFFLSIRNRKLQKHPAETHEFASNYVLDARQRLTGPNRYPDFIVVMNQTLILCSLHGKWSLDSHGTCTDDIHKWTDDTGHATLTLMVTASGRMLQPFLIFKGMAGGQIKLEFSTFPKERFYACQKSASMDEHLMKAWVEQILKPYVSRWDCPHSVVENVPLSHDGVGCIHHHPVGCGSVTHPRWLHGLVPTYWLASTNHSSLKSKSYRRTGWWTSA